MVRDWRLYNASLIKRGEIWVESSLISKIEEKDKEGKKRGRPYKYSTFLVLFLVILKFIFKMGYRQLQGFAQDFLGKLLGIAVPNFRTICYRFKFEGELPDDAIIIVDSTGMKVTNRGEWIRMRGRMKRRWVYEAKGKKIVEFKVTDERRQDCKEGLEMLKELYEKTKRSNKRIRNMIHMRYLII